MEGLELYEVAKWLRNFDYSHVEPDEKLNVPEIETYYPDAADLIERCGFVSDEDY